MSAVLNSNTPVTRIHQASPGLWTLAWRRLKRDKVGMVSLVVVVFFLLMIAGSYTEDTSVAIVLLGLGLAFKDFTMPTYLRPKVKPRFFTK